MSSLPKDSLFLPWQTPSPFQGPCGETQEFYFDVAAGEGRCRCPRGSLLHRDSRRCHSRYSRGPCLPR